MKEIKFRGRCIDTGKYVYGYVVFDSKKENAVIVHKLGNNESNHTQVYPESVSEYINSKDANGKEIYSGDILVAPSGDKFEVVWFEQEMRWAMTSDGTLMYNINSGILRVLDIANNE